VLRGSRLSLRAEARARFVEVRFRLPARRRADCALRFVDSLALAGGDGRSTPALRAFDNPIAIACFADRAPCLPSRTWWISSRTNSPACVLGDLPLRLSARARLSVSFSGMVPPPLRIGRNVSAMRVGARAYERRAGWPMMNLNAAVVVSRETAMIFEFLKRLCTRRIPLGSSLASASFCSHQQTSAVFARSR